MTAGTSTTTPPSSRMPGGIRARVTVSATVVVAITLIAAGALLLLLMQQSLVAGIDSGLVARAEQVASQTSTATSVHGLIPSTAQQSSLVQIIDANGTVIGATANMREDDNTYESPVLSSPPTLLRSVTSTLTDSPLDRGGSFRVLAQPLMLPNGQGWLYVATSLSPVDAATRSLFVLFSVGLPLLLVVVGLTIWRAVAQALKPVEQIRKQASEISARDLTQRVPEPNSTDEIARLARAMNQMLERLESSAMRQNQFIGDASHELRSPLTALRAQVDVALAHPEMSDSPRVLHIVREQVARMSVLTDDLLFLARHTEIAPQVSPNAVDLDELLLEEATRLRALGLLHITIGHVDAARTTGSHRDIARAFRNVTDNACDHALNEIRLSLTAQTGFAVITVTDDGVGLPVEGRNRLFDRFSRLEDSRARNSSGGGFGLGLAIARQITTSHGGTLTARDRADGFPGAEFQIRLPTETN